MDIGEAGDRKTEVPPQSSMRFSPVSRPGGDERAAREERATCRAGQRRRRGCRSTTGRGRPCHPGRSRRGRLRSQTAPGRLVLAGGGDHLDDGFVVRVELEELESLVCHRRVEKVEPPADTVVAVVCPRPWKQVDWPEGVPLHFVVEQFEEWGSPQQPALARVVQLPDSLAVRRAHRLIIASLLRMIVGRRRASDEGGVDRAARLDIERPSHPRRAPASGACWGT